VSRGYKYSRRRVRFHVRRTWMSFRLMTRDIVALCSSHLHPSSLRIYERFFTRAGHCLILQPYGTKSPPLLGSTPRNYKPLPLPAQRIVPNLFRNRCAVWGKGFSPAQNSFGLVSSFTLLDGWVILQCQTLNPDQVFS
jgi:hypothetical protein